MPVHQALGSVCKTQNTASRYLWLPLPSRQKGPPYVTWVPPTAFLPMAQPHVDRELQVGPVATVNWFQDEVRLSCQHLWASGSCLARGSCIAMALSMTLMQKELWPLIPPDHLRPFSISHCVVVVTKHLTPAVYRRRGLFSSRFHGVQSMVTRLLGIEGSCSHNGSHEAQREGKHWRQECTLPEHSPSGPPFRLELASKFEIIGGHFRTKP